jgi:hypothetical protein
MVVRERSFLRFMAVPVRARRNGPLAEVETAIPRVIHAQHTSVLVAACRAGVDREDVGPQDRETRRRSTASCPEGATGETPITDAAPISGI